MPAMFRCALLAAVALAALPVPRPAHSGDAPTAEEQVKALVAKGRVLLNNKQYNAADEEFANAADRARDQANVVLETEALLGRIHALSPLNQPLVLRDVATRLLGVQTRAGDDDGAADTEHDVAAYEMLLGNYPQADYHMQRVEAYWAEKGNALLTADTRLDIAKLRSTEGRIAEAWTLAEAALAVFRSVNDTALEADALQTLAGFQIFAGDYAAARDLAEKALALLDVNSQVVDVARARGLIAIADYREGNYAAARKTLLQVLDLYELVKEGDAVSNTLLHLAAIEVHERKFDSALAYAKRARGSAGDNAEADGWGLRYMGEAEVGLKHFDSALKLLAESVSIGERIRSPPLLLDALIGSAKAFLARGDLENAMDRARKACDALESLGADLDDDHRASLRATALSEAYDIGIETAVGRQDVPAAVEFIERARAGSLLQSLGGRRVLRGVGLPEALEAEERKAHEALVAAELSLKAARTAHATRAAVQRAADEKTSAEKRYEGVVARIQREAHRESAVAYPATASLNDLKAAVWPGEALVLFSVLAKKVIALVVTSSDARLVEVGRRADVEKALAPVVEVGPNAESLTPEGISAAASALFDPLALPATVKRILVSPDGILANAPFPALVAAPSNADRTIALVPSGSTYRILLEDRSRKGKRILALGDPEYGTATAPEPPFAALRGRVLSRLPATRGEVLAITRAGVDVRLLGADATEGGFREALRAAPKGERWRAVHLACHGLLNRERPGFCALAVTPGPGTTDDGFLTVHEIFASRIPADLVVLSACETALGRPDRGEGILGFVRAFFTAGAPRVVVSLWAVDDEATREWMTSFYAALDAGSPPAAALRDAQAHVRAIPKWSHPRYWAAWVLWGLSD